MWDLNSNQAIQIAQVSKPQSTNYIFFLFLFLLKAGFFFFLYFLVKCTWTGDQSDLETCAPLSYLRALPTAAVISLSHPAALEGQKFLRSHSIHKNQLSTAAITELQFAFSN